MTQTGSTPPPATPPTPPQAGSAWAAPPPPPTAGPAGFVYGDVPNRAIAYIIDAIVLGIIGVVIFAILSALGLSIISGDLSSGFVTNYGVSLIYALLGLVLSFAYFAYTWTRMRGTVGMKALGLQIGNAVDGKTLTTEQAVRRWIALGAPFSIAQALNPIGAVGNLLGLLAFLWFIFLLYSTAKSPTKQGFHDVFANSMVVKAARIA